MRYTTYGESNRRREIEKSEFIAILNSFPLDVGPVGLLSADLSYEPEREERRKSKS